MGLNTTPRTWVTGETVTAAELNTEIRDALTGIQAAWTSYVPTLTASTTNPTLGTGGSATGSYIQWGKTIIGQGRILFGSTMTAGSGTYKIALPVTANPGVETAVGVAYLFDSSGSTIFFSQMRFLAADSGTTARLFGATTSPYDATNALPWVWAANDAITFQFNYQAA